MLWLIHNFQRVCESRTLAVRLKIQRCINKARDTLPTLDSHSSAEVVKGSSAPAYKTLAHAANRTNYSDVWACVRTPNNTLHLCICVCVWLPCCLDNLQPFLFLFALGAVSALTPTQKQESEQREYRECPGFFISPLEWTTPTALPPALTCQAANVGWSCWYVYREETEKRVSYVNYVF